MVLHDIKTSTASTAKTANPPQKKTLVFQVGPFKASWVEWPTYSHAGQSDKTFWKNPWSLEVVLGSCLVCFVNMSQTVVRSLT